jgi:septum formation protein
LIILASSSERRRHLLREAGIEFSIEVPDIDETFNSSLPIDEQVLDVARRKAHAVEVPPGHVVIAADTTVVYNNELFAKPMDIDDAKRMLQLFSGQIHQVKTAVVMKGRIHAEWVETTDVHFYPIHEEQLQAYLDSHEWQGKAGSYAIQGFAKAFVKHIEGDYDNIVGLPVTKIKELLS